jgi:hypothetical protein
MNWSVVWPAVNVSGGVNDTTTGSTISAAETTATWLYLVAPCVFLALRQTTAQLLCAHVLKLSVGPLPPPPTLRPPPH